MRNCKVVINNRNRLTTTKNMVEKLLQLNPDEQIIIIDNGSTYPPLLEWYKTINVEVYFEKNEGHLALWATQLDKVLGEFFVYTDSDIILNENFLESVDEYLFKADTDTTFSFMKNFFDNCYPSLRITRPDMICRHHGWYLDLDNLDEEEKYYLEHLENTTTQYSKQHKNPELYNDI
jgi:glycosyltransferase involved in cell wall biosynthesis